MLPRAFRRRARRCLRVRASAPTFLMTVSSRPRKYRKPRYRARLMISPALLRACRRVVRDYFSPADHRRDDKPFRHCRLRDFERILSIARIDTTQAHYSSSHEHFTPSCPSGQMYAKRACSVGRTLKASTPLLVLRASAPPLHGAMLPRRRWYSLAVAAQAISHGHLKSTMINTRPGHDGRDSRAAASIIQRYFLRR